MKSRCFTTIPEAEAIKMAALGLDFSVRKKLVNQYIIDMTQLAERVRQIEQLQIEKSNRYKRFTKKERVAFADYESVSNSEDDEEEVEVDVAELKFKQPYTCQALVPSRGKEKMNFINKKHIPSMLAKLNKFLICY